MTAGSSKPETEIVVEDVGVVETIVIETDIKVVEIKVGAVEGILILVVVVDAKVNVDEEGMDKVEAVGVVVVENVDEGKVQICQK